MKMIDVLLAEMDQEANATRRVLGVRRAGVTEAAGQLQGRGLIQYRRGSVQVINRPALEAIACPCYGAANSVYQQHLGASTR